MLAGAFGLRKTLDAILLEVCHPYCNWKETVPRLRSFVLKNISRYFRHDLGPQAFTLFSGIFLDALLKPQVRDEKHISDTVESMLAYVNRLVSEIERDLHALALYGPRLGQFFDCIRGLDSQDEQIMMRIVQGHHPMKEVAVKLVALAEPDGAPDFDFTPIARLMRLILERNLYIPGQ